MDITLFTCVLECSLSIPLFLSLTPCMSAVFLFICSLPLLLLQKSGVVTERPGGQIATFEMFDLF